MVQLLGSGGLELIERDRFRVWGLPGPQKSVKIMAFMTILMGVGLLFYILLVSR